VHYGKVHHVRTGKLLHDFNEDNQDQPTPILEFTVGEKVAPANLISLNIFANGAFDICQGLNDNWIVWRGIINSGDNVPSFFVSVVLHEPPWRFGKSNHL
jgi:hypothetical protein